jgi:hypothetical protein
MGTCFEDLGLDSEGHLKLEPSLIHVYKYIHVYMYIYICTYIDVFTYLCI